MISTTTTANTTANNITLDYYPKSTRQTILELLSSVKASGHVPSHDDSKIIELSYEFQTLNNPTDRQMAILLHELINEVLYPAIENYTKEQLDLLLNFEEQALELFKNVTPEGMSASKYLESFSHEKVVIQILKQYSELYIKQKTLIETCAKIETAKLAALVETTRQAFVEALKTIQTQDEMLKTRVADLTNKMNNLSQDCQQITASSQAAVANFNQLQTNIAKNLGNV